MNQIRLNILTLMLSCCFTASGNAYDLINADTTKLKADLEVGLGYFNSSQDYHFMGTDRGAVDWTEGYFKTDLSGSINSWYGGFSALGTATMGNGDAGGFTTGDEKMADIENAFVGWKNEKLDISVGRQGFALGDGFLVAGDALNMGLGFQNIGAKEVNRGGAYWLAPRQAFQNTVIAKYQSDIPLRGDLFWLQSGNAAQGSTELTGINAEWADVKRGTMGASFMKVTAVDKTEFFGTFAYRKNMSVFSLRGNGSLGLKNTSLSFEYVEESFDVPNRNNANAWYVEAEYTFSDMAMSPSVGYRYSFFSETFDPLFYGMSRGYGTWFQGEVSGNYTGPYNSNASIQQFSLRFKPQVNVSGGLLFFTYKGDKPKNDYAKELNLYVEWGVNDNIFISPVYSRYMPDKGFPGANNKNADYFQVIMVFRM